MPTDESPSSLLDPQYASTVVGVLAIGALYAYWALTGSGPASGEIAFVLLAVFLPMAVAYDAARRWPPG